MNLREHAAKERAGRTNGLGFATQPIGRSPGSWLASYPVFQHVMASGETTFGALPDYARRVALLRAPTDPAQETKVARTLDDLRVSFVELCTPEVSAVVDDYLRGAQTQESGLNNEASPVPPGLGDPIPGPCYPLIARPPCLLRPGRHIFADGWMRFFAYRSRGDFTIPLLAIDWLDFHGRLEGLLPDS